MKVLALDTASVRGSVALLEGPEIAAQMQLLSLETHSARLLSSLDFLMKSAAWSLGDIGLVVAGMGPGSFTGIRIGVSTAVGLARTLSIPFAGVSGLDACAHLLRDHDGRIAVVLDAQRAQVYYAEYSCRHGRIKRAGKPALLAPGDLQFGGRSARRFLIGDGAVRYAAELGINADGWPRLVEADLFLAASMGRLALARKRSWRCGESICPRPLYIRPPDAQKRKVPHR